MEQANEINQVTDQIIQQLQIKLTEKQKQQLFDQTCIIDNICYIHYFTDEVGKFLDKKELVEYDIIDKIKKACQLNFWNYSFKGNQEKKTYTVYQEFSKKKVINNGLIEQNKKYLIVPVQFIKCNLSSLNKQIKSKKNINQQNTQTYQFQNVINNEQFIGKNVLRLQQQQIVDKVLNNLFVIKNDKKIICQRRNQIMELNVGTGKTVMALYLMQKLNLKTLIAVRTQSLQDQWIQRIQQYIQILNKQTNTYGKIELNIKKLGGIVNITDDISIGIINTLSSQDIQTSIDKKIADPKTNQLLKKLQIKKLTDEDNEDNNLQLLNMQKQISQQQLIKDKFSILIVDECHILGAENFRSILQNFCKCNYVFALSGTPDRQDNLHKIYYNYFDNIINLPIKSDVNIKVNVKLINNIDLVNFSKSYTQADKYYQIIQRIIICQVRHELIIQSLKQVLKDKQYALIISERVDHVEYFYDYFTKQGIQCDRLYAKYNDIKKSQLLFATLSQAKEGLDYPYLNVLVQLTPSKGDIQGLKQLVGRITRSSGADDNQQKLVIDFQDLAFGKKNMKRYNQYSEILDKSIIEQTVFEQFDIISEGDQKNYKQKLIDYDQYLSLF